jgi:hypothetical protein
MIEREEPAVGVESGILEVAYVHVSACPYHLCRSDLDAAGRKQCMCGVFQAVWSMRIKITRSMSSIIIVSLHKTCLGNDAQPIEMSDDFFKCKEAQLKHSANAHCPEHEARYRMNRLGKDIRAQSPMKN